MINFRICTYKHIYFLYTISLTTKYTSMKVDTFSVILLQERKHFASGFLAVYMKNFSIVLSHSLSSKCDLVKDCDTIVVSCRSEVQRTNNEYIRCENRR